MNSSFHIFGFLHSDGRRVRLPGRFTDAEFTVLVSEGLPRGMFCWHLDGDDDIRIPLIELLPEEPTDPAAILADYVTKRQTRLYVEITRTLYTPLSVPLQVAIADRPKAYKRRLFTASVELVKRFFPAGSGVYREYDIEDFFIIGDRVATFNS